MTAAASPRPVGDVDAELLRLLAGIHRSRWIFLAVAGVVLVAAVAVLGVLYAGQRGQIARQDAVITEQEKQLQSSCEFFQPLTGLPVTPPAGEKTPSKLGVQIIAGARTAYSGQRCGHLPAPAGSLVTWAAHYKIPVAR